jgi:tripartite-type tricarboxylate transporter receptor subunit TctC
VQAVDAQSWYTLLVPAATPRDITDKLSRELVRIIRTAEVREQLARQALDAEPMTHLEFTRFLQNEIAKWGKLARAVGIKTE